ncbi:MAG: glycosyltransferase family 2 protein [Blastocatellia bacterium]|nr:glycosyltransferase family 2 protein [Blastocatellia bacterium]
MIETIISIAGSVVAAATLPGSVEILLLTFGAALLKEKADKKLSDEPVKLAIVIPAHNEETSVSQTVSSILKCRTLRHTVSVVVLADNCTDNTVEVAKQAGARVIVRNDLRKKGKGFALEYAFGILLAEDIDAVVVVDADTEVKTDMVEQFCKKFSEGADAVQCYYGVNNSSDSFRTRLMNVALLAFNRLRPLGRQRLGLSVGVLGNGFGLTRKTLLSVPYTASSVVEDLEYHLKLVKAGCKVEFIDTTAVYAEMPAAGRGVKTQRARWEGGRLRILVEHAPELVREVTRGRIAAIEPLLDLMLLPLAFHCLLLGISLFTPITVVKLYAVSSLVLVLLHILAAVVIGKGSWKDLASLLTAPFYILWKLTIIPALIVASRKDASWIRTTRKDA